MGSSKSPLVIKIASITAIETGIIPRIPRINGPKIGLLLYGSLNVTIGVIKTITNNANAGK